MTTVNALHNLFQPSLPARGATVHAITINHVFFYFNPRSPRGERRLMPQIAVISLMISTLAPREGSDDFGRDLAANDDISTLAPREGSD